MNGRFLITISGPPASGTSTLASQLESSLHLELVSGGDMFRQMAIDRGQTVSAFASYAKQNPSVDTELDERLESIMNAHINAQRDSQTDILIVESRLAGWLAPEKSLQIRLEAPLEERATRIGNRDETKEQLKQRQQNDKHRYKDLYGVDVEDHSLYDVIIDSSKIDKRSLLQLITELVTVNPVAETPSTTET